MTAPIAYIPRIADYYRGLGYGKPYQWARFDWIPFTRPSSPPSRLALITTAARVDPVLGDQAPGAAYNAKAKFYDVYAAPLHPLPLLSIAHIAYDRRHTSAQDQNSFFPLDAFARITGLTPRYYGLPTNRSQNTTCEKDAPRLLELLREDGADAAVLIANCPVCHQSTALAARHLEENNIPTVLLGCARDIVDHIGVPRFLFSDFPLGNAAGKPHDQTCQQHIATMAVDFLVTATRPGEIVQTPFIWDEDASWKEDYSNIAKLTDAEIQQRRAEFDRGKQIARTIRTQAHGS